MGAWQGVWVTRLGVSSFIVTLAGMLYFRGGSMIMTAGTTVAPVPAALTEFATGFIAPAYSVPLVVSAATAYIVFAWLTARRARSFGVGGHVRGSVVRRCVPVVLLATAAVWLVSWAGLPYLILLVAICAISAELLLRGTRLGAQFYAIGGNPEAARLAGIDVKRVVFTNFVIAGLVYGITGIALTARVSGAVAGSAGVFLELDAIAAAIIGGTSLQGGRGRVVGALLGALLMGSLNNGMSLMNVRTFYQETARGVVLLLAVAIDQLNRRRAG